jgi:beta-phosphoglucomutase-like phosphatase (HAD superfamily)
LHDSKSTIRLRARVIETLFFDLDGTLIDTEMAASQAIHQSFEEWGIKIQNDDAQFITGRTWEKAFDFLFNKYPIPLSPQEAGQRMLERYRKGLKEHLIEVPGARDCVRRLAAVYPLALISGSHRSEILFALDQLGIRSHFKVILGAEDYPQSKPAPDGYLKALGLMGAKAESTLVFEDSEAGVASALAAGLKTCVITSTNHFGVNTSGGHYFLPDLRPVDVAWVRALT